MQTSVKKMEQDVLYDEVPEIRLKKPKPSFGEDEVVDPHEQLIDTTKPISNDSTTSNNINKNTNYDNISKELKDNSQETKKNNQSNNNSQRASTKRTPIPIDSVDVDHLFENLDKISLKQITPVESLAIFNRTIHNLLDLYHKIELQQQGHLNSPETEAKLLDLNSIIFDHPYHNHHSSSSTESSSSFIFSNSNESGLSVQSALSSVVSIPILEGDITTNNSNSSINNNKLQDISSKLLDDLELPLKKKSRIYSNFEDLMSADEEKQAEVESIIESGSEDDLQQSNDDLNDNPYGNLNDDTYDDTDALVQSRKPNLLHERKPSEEEDKYEVNTNRSFDDCIELMKSFYLLNLPTLTVEKYLERLDKFLAPSTSIYLTASLYLFNIAFNLKTSLRLLSPESQSGLSLTKKSRIPLKAPLVDLKMVPIEPLNIFRLILCVIRIALRLIEDINHKQREYCKIVGIQKVKELFHLELHFLFLIDFNLVVDEYILLNHIYQMRVFDKNMKALRNTHDLSQAQ